VSYSSSCHHLHHLHCPSLAPMKSRYNWKNGGLNGGRDRRTDGERERERYGIVEFNVPLDTGAEQ